MGYDLHLTRADDWVGSGSAPVPLAEWVAAARTAPELTPADAVDDGTGAPVFLLGHDPEDAPALYWVDGRVTVRGATGEHVEVLARLADRLGATLLGDDGEPYS